MAKTKNYHVGGEQLPLILPDSKWKRPKELPDLRRHKRIAIDRECKDNGLAFGRGPGWAFGPNGDGHLCGVSAAWKSGNEYEAAYFPTRHPDTECFDPERVAEWELDHQKAGVRMVMQNAPYDVGWGEAQLGVPCPEIVDDTTCMAYMVDENRQEYNLDALCEWQGLPGKDTELLDTALAVYGYPPHNRGGMEHLFRLPARYVGRYAEVDSIRALQLADVLDVEIERQNIREAYQLEMDLLPVVHAMRKRGIRVDLNRAEREKERFMREAMDGLAELSDKLGMRVGIDELRSNSWLVKVFSEHKVPFAYDEFSRKASFDSKWMKSNLQQDHVDGNGKKSRRWVHWLPRLYVHVKSRWDASEKFIGTYIMDFAVNGRLHATVNQFKSESGGTRTYRFSYADPPLQQMPNRDEDLAEAIRGLFLPEIGDWWLAADYSQQEYRLIVHFAERLRLRRASEAADQYRQNPRTDFHSLVAEMTGLDRKPAKDSNFAKSYGAGIPKFATMINKTVEEAEAIMKQYDEKLPFTKALNQESQKRADRKGFIRLLDGARIHYDKWEPSWLTKEERDRGWGSTTYKMYPCSLAEAKERQEMEGHPWRGKRLRRADTRKAMNGLIQGSAARQTKLAMRACWREGYLPLIQMHDELGFSLNSEAAGERVTQIMREIVTLRVPMQVDAEWGTTWGDAKHSWKDRNKRRK